jgi:hypothetical protein
VTDTEANTIVRPLYLFITIVIIKEGRTKKNGFSVEFQSWYQVRVFLKIVRKIQYCLIIQLQKLKKYVFFLFQTDSDRFEWLTHWWTPCTVKYTERSKSLGTPEYFFEWLKMRN